MTFAEILRRKRTAAQLSQEAAAARADVSARTWNRTENGKYDPSPSLLAQMAAAVGITPEELENVGQDMAADILRSRQEDEPATDDDETIRRLFADLTAQIPAGYNIRSWHGTKGEHGVEVTPIEAEQRTRGVA